MRVPISGVGEEELGAVKISEAHTEEGSLYTMELLAPRAKPEGVVLAHVPRDESDSLLAR